MLRRTLFAAAIAWFALGHSAAAASPGFSVPNEFEVSLFAGDDLAHDIFSLTLDGQGRVVVSGAGYIKTLIDDNADGQADRAVPLVTGFPKSGAFGMLFADRDLLVTGDNAIWRVHCGEGQVPATEPPTQLFPLRTAEHGSHGIVRGPDGWFYIMCGNDAKAGAAMLTSPRSPVREPEAGVVLRLSPDGRYRECVAHGFRNACDLAFSAEGHLFTYDSDGERDQHLPWYAPTRVFDVHQGQHHGWVNEGWQSSWSRPPAWFDVVERVAELGRGSPTGVCVYRHALYPAKYHNGLFACCWTLGRVYYLPRQPRGDSFASEAEIFLKSDAGHGFAPTDIAVGPAGEMYVSSGGRGTQGQVYVVRPKLRADKSSVVTEPTTLVQVLDFPQPDAAWSRSLWEPAARKLGSRDFAECVTSAEFTSTQRVRAVEILVDVFEGLSPHLAAQIDAEKHPELAARCAWALGRRASNAAAEEVLATYTRARDPRVVRAAFETIDVDQHDAAFWQRVAFVPDRGFAGARQYWAARNVLQSNQPLPAAPAAVEVKSLSDDALLIRVRQLMLAAGDVAADKVQPGIHTGFVLKSPGRATPVEAELVGRFPTPHAALNRELARLFGLMQTPDAALRERLVEQITAESPVTDDLHYLIVLSRLPGERSPLVTEKTAAALARLHGKMIAGELYASRNWPDRVGELARELLARDSALGEALVGHEQFALPVQGLFVEHLPRSLQRTAIERLLAAALRNDEARWTGEFTRLVGTLDSQAARSALRARWSDFTVRDSVAVALAQKPEKTDRALFVEALLLPDAKAVEHAAGALAQLGRPTTAEELTAALSALRTYCQAAKYASVRKALHALLAAWSGQSFPIADRNDEGNLEAYAPWFAWFRREYPQAARQFEAAGQVDLAEWQKRWPLVDWNSGDVTRGRVEFEKRNCFKCHFGQSRFGPDLANAAKRLSRDDLFTSILDPNKDVSPTYRTTAVITAAGKSTVGMLLYESPESTLLQVSPDETVRVAGEEIVAMKPSGQSLMPAGLLHNATNQELADLYRYLQSLGE